MEDLQLMVRLCMRKQGGAEELKAAFNAYIRKVRVCMWRGGWAASQRNNPSNAYLFDFI